MGLGLALPVASATGISVTTGVAQGVSEQKKANADASNQTRMLKFHLDVWVESSSTHSKTVAQLNDGIVTLHNGRLWVEPKNSQTKLPQNVDHHPFTGFYLAYPDDSRGHTRGLVSTISVDPPMLNWIYVDKDTMEMKYANRSGSIVHHVGDYDWTSEDHEKDDSCVTFDDWEGFLAVEEQKGKWALYFDMDDDGLKQHARGRKTIEVRLQRRVISGQEANKWGLKEDGNIGFRKTREV